MGEITDTNITLVDNSKNKTRTIWYGNFHSIEKQFVRLLDGAWELRINRVYRMLSKDKAEIDKIYDVLTKAISKWYDKYHEIAPRKSRPTFLSKSPSALVQKANEKTNKNERSLVISIQQELKTHGYYRMKVDGLYGPGTAAAIKAYQRDNNLPPDGRISKELLAHLESGKERPDVTNKNSGPKKNKKSKTIEAAFNEAVDEFIKVIFKKK
jgi:hypothetical protein